MTLHKELNKASKNPNLNSNIFIDEKNNEQVLNNFIQCFTNENKSIISDIFYGVNNTGTQCFGCKITKYNYQSYYYLIFPLEEVRKTKKQNLQNKMLVNMNNINNINYFNNMNNNSFYNQQNFINMQNAQNLQNTNSVTIYECFDYNVKFEYFMGEN